MSYHILVFRDLLMLTIDQSECIQQISSSNVRFRNTGLHLIFLGFQIEWFALLLTSLLVLFFFLVLLRLLVNKRAATHQSVNMSLL